jgi:hypothetical protein
VQVTRIRFSQYLLSALQAGKSIKSAPVRILPQRFQHLNIIPQRVSAEFSSSDLLHIEADVWWDSRRAADAHRWKAPPGAEHRGCLLASTGLRSQPDFHHIGVTRADRQVISGFCIP